MAFAPDTPTGMAMLKEMGVPDSMIVDWLAEPPEGPYDATLKRMAEGAMIGAGI